MPRLEKALPKLGRHKNQACVYLDGRRIYLGVHGSKCAQQAYDRIVGEWLASGRRLPTPTNETIVAEVLLAYLKHAKSYYRKDGKETNEVTQIKNAMAHVKSLYANMPADSFGPLALEVVRNRMIEVDWSRKVINKQVSRIVRMFKWAASRQMIAAHVPNSLATLSGLKKGRTSARETEPVQPIADEIVEQTLPELGPIVADMVRIQRLTGCRPGELCLFREKEIDRTSDVWVFAPPTHKMEHKGTVRLVFIGLEAQRLLSNYLLRSKDAYCFDPREAPKARSNSKERYTKDSYGRAVRRAVERVNRKRKAEFGESVQLLELWSPNRLRHTRASEIRKEHGLEGSQVVLGHASADVTQIYAERDHELAKRIARKSG